MSVLSWRRAGREDAGLALLLAAAGAGGAILLPLAPFLAGFAPTCPFHALTGMPCPGCGTTRAILALSGGDLGAAFAFNPLATLAAFAGAVASLLAVPWVLLRGPLPVLASVSPARLRLAVATSVGIQWLWLVARGV